LRVDRFLIWESLLGVLGALCGSKKPPKKPHGVRAYTSEPEASAPGVARGITTEHTGHTEKREKGKELERVIR
jgi:hypothetical protein